MEEISTLEWRIDFCELCVGDCEWQGGGEKNRGYIFG